MTLPGRKKGATMDRRRVELRRRDLARLLVALPAAPALLRADAKKEDPPSPTAEFLAAQEKGLSAAERQALKKSVGGFEKSLQAIRDFALAPEVPPSFRFAARKSRAR
jgi:hypothetical protein